MVGRPESAKHALNSSLSLLLLLALVTNVIPTIQASGQPRLWAVLAACCTIPTAASNDMQYMYHVLTQNYTFDGIYYLDRRTLPGVNANATKANFQWAIKTWLDNRADKNDIIFIFIVGHGGGYNVPDGNHWLPNATDHSRYDDSGDEGEEVLEGTFRTLCPRLNRLYDFDKDGVDDDRLRNFDNDTYLEIDFDDDGPPYVELNESNFLDDRDGDGSRDDLYLDPDKDDRCDIAIDALTSLQSDGEEAGIQDGFIQGLDLNGNGNFDDWVGIDECIIFSNLDAPDMEMYWDEEFADDLDRLDYAELIFARVGCTEEGGGGCYNGGLIDDISAPNRTVMTASNETYFCWADFDDPGEPGYGYSEWSEAFIDALHGERTYYDVTTHEIVHTGIEVDADVNNDGNVSMWEAFEYAWDNDEARLAGLETPWIDDNGNGLPTYEEEHDELDHKAIDGSYCRDGLLAWETYLGFKKLKTPDIAPEIVDHQVDMEDIRTFARAFGGHPSHPRWNPDADLYVDNKNDMKDVCIAARMFGKTYSSSSSSSATSSPTVSVSPDEITVRKHETFSLNVTVTNVTDLAGYQFELYYNTTVLNCTGIELPSGHFLEPAVDPDMIFTVRLEYDNKLNSTHGLVWAAVTLLGEEPSKNGSGTLVTINFTATAIGSSVLNLYNTKLVNTWAEAIPTIVVNGSATVLPSLTVLAEDQYGNPLTTGDVYIDDELVGYTGSTFTVATGTHELFVNDFWEGWQEHTGYRYGFKNWTDGSVDNPRNVTILEDTTITAYFHKKWCPGDVNGDGKCDMKDIALVASLVGTHRGDPDWDSRADVYRDEKIDMKDVATVARYFGNEYPDP